MPPISGVREGLTDGTVLTNREILDLQLADRRGAWDMQADGSYLQRRPEPKDEQRSAQELLIERSEKRLAEARRLYKKQYPKKIAKRKSK